MAKFYTFIAISKQTLYQNTKMLSLLVEFP